MVSDNKMPEVVGIAEIADLAQASRQTICNWRDRYDTFPKPDQILRSGPIWQKAVILAWLQTKTRA